MSGMGDEGTRERGEKKRGGGGLIKLKGDHRSRRARITKQQVDGDLSLLLSDVEVYYMIILHFYAHK